MHVMATLRDGGFPRYVFERLEGVGAGGATHRCRLCGKEVSHAWNHFHVHFPGRFACPHCTSIFSRNDSLHRHIRTKHSAAPPPKGPLLPAPLAIPPPPLPPLLKEDVDLKVGLLAPPGSRAAPTSPQKTSAHSPSALALSIALPSISISTVAASASSLSAGTGSVSSRTRIRTRTPPAVCSATTSFTPAPVLSLTSSLAPESITTVCTPSVVPVDLPEPAVSPPSPSSTTHAAPSTLSTSTPAPTPSLSPVLSPATKLALC